MQTDLGDVSSPAARPYKHAALQRLNHQSRCLIKFIFYILFCFTTRTTLYIITRYLTSNEWSIKISRLVLTCKIAVLIRRFIIVINTIELSFVSHT
ncbi:hypothetical protein GDO86_007455 [Hymenochirus boettgeri]|uniref:Uncharacterized protein n=1 Tax=Hymenochirus boettgeri TaxID=247094 RepID=A0A8T2IZ70_9PIPI|nr:hypothetical protein GDO86_007455 [Hymenochirus boettgeri]